MTKYLCLSNFIVYKQITYSNNKYLKKTSKIIYYITLEALFNIIETKNNAYEKGFKVINEIIKKTIHIIILYVIVLSYQH